jgi:3-oxoacyl-[acyl-carrier protein] reductase
VGALDGKVALITGSSRGIGAEIARSFAAEGAKVALHGRDRSALTSVRYDIESRRGTAISLLADVTRFHEIEGMRRAIENRFGPIEILVANAGASLTDPGLALEEISEEGWHASVDANLTATFLTLKSVLPGMKARKSGVIITVSSAAGRRPNPRSPIPYAVSKAAIQLLTQDLATQVGPYGIRANCIAPETILTERNEEQIPVNVREGLINMHPIRRLGTPQDVAEAAVFLASERSAWITGIVVDVAGGAVML